MNMLYNIDKGEMPPAEKYVLAHLRSQPWISNDSQGVLWKVVCTVYGLSMQDREKLALHNDPRANLYCFGDEHGNNLRPWAFKEFGSSQFFGQEVDYWCELPIL